MSAEDAAYTGKYCAPFCHQKEKLNTNKNRIPSSPEALFRSPLLFGPDANFDEITPELFELKVTGLSRGRRIDPAVYKNMSQEDRTRLKDDSKPRDYLNLTNRTEGDKKKNRFGPFSRDWKTGRLDDDQLADALIKAITVPAASFRARGVPHVMRVIEILVRRFLWFFQFELKM
jgi:hypothetical protein